MTRSKRIKNISTGAAAVRAEKKRFYGFERSKFTSADHHNLNKLGLLMDKGKMKIPGDEATANPPEGFQNHQILSSLPHVPVNGEVPERTVLNDDLQEASVRSLLTVQQHIQELEKKLEDSENSRKDAEAKAASADELQTRLTVAEFLYQTSLSLSPNVLPEKMTLFCRTRQAIMKIGVEGIIALALASGEKLDWAKVATVRGLNKEKWTGLLRNTKAFSKIIIAIIDPTSSFSTSTAQTEVK
ncbi:hypothetical protein QYE76_029373 [Lolium multiflorum]|uniref:Uncharacterized protein n=1 Tax=Lolium multiflorum TaxID=4521 RepID=A0AAD8QMN8_LOLMU|nr:hypothetical protein QYE76_029373 [Lolium multiflorum]